MKSFLLLTIPLVTLVAACSQAPMAKSAFQQSAEDLSTAYDLVAKKQLLVNNQEKHAAEMARQEAELQLRARGIELSAAVERLAAEQKVLGEEIRRRPPPPPPSRSAVMVSPPEDEASRTQLAEEQQAPTAPVVVFYAPSQEQEVTTVVEAPRQYYMSRMARSWAEEEAATSQRSTSTGRGRRVLRNTAVWTGIGAGTGAAVGAIHSGSRGAASGSWKGAAAGAALGFLVETIRR